MKFEIKEIQLTKAILIVVICSVLMVFSGVGLALMTNNTIFIYLMLLLLIPTYFLVKNIGSKKSVINLEKEQSIFFNEKEILINTI